MFDYSICLMCMEMGKLVISFPYSPVYHLLLLRFSDSFDLGIPFPLDGVR